MKKSISLILMCVVLIAIACAVVLVSGAESGSANVLELSKENGVFFDGMQLYTTAEGNNVQEIPVTYEAWVKVPAGYNEYQGFIYSNYDTMDPVSGTRFGALTNGRPYLSVCPVGGSNMNFYPTKCQSIANSEWTHITIVDDTAAGEVRYYINGIESGKTVMTAAQKSASRSVSQRSMCLGGYFKDGTDPFYGYISSVVVYSDVRTEKEIEKDMISINLDDECLISAYDLNGKQGADVLEDATGNYNMISNRATEDWVSPEYVPEPTDYAYSIALVGDTQLVSYFYPQVYDTYFDWLLANKDAQKIKHVLNLGDLTNYNLDWEWDMIKEQWFRLNNKLDYTLVRGDHDVLDDKVEGNGVDKDKYDKWFDDPQYTGRFGTNGGLYRGNDGSITNSYRVVDIKAENNDGINKYLIITLDKYPSDGVLSWVDSVVAQYPDRRLIMTMHCFIDNDGSLLADNNIGDTIWNHIKKYNNLEMVICGHAYAWGVTWVKAVGDNGNTVNWVLVNPQGPDFDRSGATGMIAMLYFSEDGKNVQVRYYSPVLDKYYVGNHNYDEFTEQEQPYKTDTSLFTVDLTTDDKVVPVELLTTPVARQPVVGDLDTTSTVEYKEGDDFAAKLNYALELSKNHDVEFVMHTNYTASSILNSVTFGSEIAIPTYKVTIKSADGVTASINTNGLNLIFWGQIVLDDVSVIGNNESSKNLLFFPQGASVVIENVTTQSDKRVNVAGADIVIKSGTWKEVCAIIDYTVIDGYTKKTLSDGKTVTKRKIFMEDVKITLTGTAKANDVFGGAYTKDSNACVIGSSEVKILEQASVTGFAAASGNGDGGTYDGNLYVNTTGTIGKTCAAVGPVGKDDGWNNCYPDYTLTIDNVSATTDTGFVGVYASKGSTSTYANTVITVNGGTFTRKCYHGLLSYSSYVKNYGTNKLTINGGSFNGSDIKVYDSILDGVGCEQHADATVVINGGVFDTSIYFGAWFNKINCKKIGKSDVTINGGKFNKSVLGGSFFRYDGSATNDKPTNCEHSGSLNFEINGGEFAANIWGGSEFGGTQAKHTGDIKLDVKNGTFGTSTKLYGQSCMYGNKTLHSGDVELTIYGGVAFKADVYGGGLTQTAGKSYSETKEISGDITFNILDKDVNGNTAAATFGGMLHAGSYLNGYWTIHSGDINYNFKGITMPGTSAGGCNAVAGKAKMTGEIVGTLENVKFNGNFYGASRLTSEYSLQEGDSTLIFINTNVFSHISAGALVSHKSATVTGDSVFELRSGYVSSNGAAIGGCYYTVPNVKISGNSKLVFGTVSTAPYVNENGKVVGGSYGSNASFTASGATTEWGMYGSSELIINGGEVKTGAYAIGGSWVSTTSTPTTTVDWDNYPVVGGVSGTSNKNTIKLTINGGTVNGPRMYAGSYLANGGQDHGTVELQINGGTVKLDSKGITNYGSKAVAALHPCTYYSAANKTLNCNYVLTLAGGLYNIVDRFGVSAGLSDFEGTITGNTVFNLSNVNMESSSVFTNQRPSRFVAGMHNITGTMIGNSTVNLGTGGVLFAKVESTFGCWGSSDKADVQGDNIKYGFTQIGDVTFNMTDGVMKRASYSSGYRSNLDGNVYLNISGGTVNNWLFGGGMSGANGYSSVTGDIVWRISGGKFDGEIFGGSRVQSGYTYTGEYNVVLGNIYMEITGGAFNNNVFVAGNNSLLKTDTINGEARIKFVGDKYSFGTNGKIVAHGTDCSAYAGTYTLDMYRADKAVPYTESGFTQIFKPFDGSAEIVLANVPAEGIIPETELKSIIPETVYGYSYAALTKFDGMTEYDNAFTIHDAEKDTKLDKLPLNVVEVCFGVGDKRTGVVGRNYFSLCAATLYMDDALTLKYKAMNSIFTSEGLGFTDPYITIAIDRGESGGLFESGEIYPVKDGNGDYVVDDSGRILFEFKGLSPAFMGAPATIVLHGTRNGVDCSAGTISYNIVSYAKNLLVNENAPQEMKKLVVDLLYYGAEVQKYSNTNVDNLPTAIFSEEPYKQYAALKTEWNNMTLTDNSNADKDLNNPTASFTPQMDITGAVLNFDNSIRIDITVGMNDAEVFNGAKAVIWTAGFSKTHTIVLGDIDDINQRRANARALEANSAYGHRYRVSFRDLVPNMGRECFYIKFVDAEGNDLTNTLCYSFESYSRRVLDSESAGEQVKDLARALMAYCDSARDYVAFKNNK